MTASTTSTVFVPGWRWTVNDRARPADQLAILSFSTPSTAAEVAQAHGAPLQATTVVGGALVSWPLAWMVARGPALRLPVGRFTFEFWTAVTTSSMPSLRAARDAGSSCRRTAYFWEPFTPTWATPLTVEMRWARSVSAYSSTLERGRVDELRARKRTG